MSFIVLLFVSFFNIFDSAVAHDNQWTEVTIITPKKYINI